MTATPLPGVTLTQTSVAPSISLNEAELYPCLVSPVYRVVAGEQIFPAATAANNYLPTVSSEVPLNLNYPVMDPGAVIDLVTYPPIVTLNNAIHKYLTTSTGALPGTLPPTSLANLNGFYAGAFPLTVGAQLPYASQGQTLQNNLFVDSAATFITKGVKAGDILTANPGSPIVPPATSSIYSYVIQAVVNQTTLILARPIQATFTGTDTGYNICRTETSWNLGSLYWSADQFGIHISSWSDGLSGSFLSGNITVSYRALRSDLSGLYKFTSLAEVQALMETTSPQNKLGYFIQNAIIPANGNTRDFQVYILTSDNSSAYINALSNLMKDTSYMFVPLCDNLSDAQLVRNTYKANMDAMSAPAESAFRVVFLDTFNTTAAPLITSTTLASGSVAL